MNLDALLCLPLLLLAMSRSSRTKKGDIFIDLCRLEQVVCLAIAVSAKTAFALFSPTLPGLDCYAKGNERQVRDLNEVRLLRRI